MATRFFFDDTSPVEKCDIYRRKDKVLTTCVDTMPADIPHDTYTFVIRSHVYPRNKIVAMTYAPTHVYFLIQHSLKSDQLRHEFQETPFIVVLQLLMGG